MGKGDQKSKRGKIIRGTYGVRRSHKTNKPEIVKVVKKPAPAPEVKVKPEKTAIKAAKPKAAPKTAAKSEPKIAPKVKSEAKTAVKVKSAIKATIPAAKTAKSSTKKKEEE
jgi:30S ribosomal protein S31